MIRNWLLILGILIWAGNSSAQSDIPVGTWRTHNSYNSLVSITAGNEIIVAANANAIFTYDPANKELDIITSLSGLNDTDIGTVGYNKDAETLIVSYSNGNIDLISNKVITNFPDLLIAEISGSKKVNHIYNQQNLSYLSADFGVLILDMDRLEVKETLFELGPGGQKIKIYASTISSDTLYLATEIGVMRGSLQDNLKDFNQWNLFDSTSGLPSSTTRVILATPTGLLVAVDYQGIFEYDGTSWQNQNLLTQSIFINGTQDASNLLLTTLDSVYQYSSNAAEPIVTPLSSSPRGAIFMDNNIWIADNENGLIDITGELSIYPNGPWENDIVKLVNFEDVIIGLPPAYDSFFQPLRNKSGYFIFKEGNWENFNSTGNPHINEIPEFYDVTDAVFSNANKALFLSSFGYGILELTDIGYKIVDENSPGSPLINTKPPLRNVLISALTLNNGFLSVTNFSATQSLHQNNLSTESWLSYSPLLPSANAIQIIDVGNGILWMRIARIFGGGIKVYNTFNQQELYLTRTASSGNLPSNDVLDMALDKDGKMWVATAKGVVYYHNALNIFDGGDLNPVLPVFDGQVLFKNELVSSLAIDGGNRVWMSTLSGLWLFDDDGSTIISHFNSDDDPLPSSAIIDLAINQSNGEIFIATKNSLVSYRGTSTSAGQLKRLKIFPNPVVASQSDIVTIEGVPENAEVIITDASGRLIYKTKANGNTAIWQGISSNQSLSSGVYFVFVSNNDGSETQVGKIAIIN